MNCVYNANENTMVIGYYLNESEFLKIEVFNSMGQLLTESEELFHSSDRTFKLNLKEHLSSGLYFVNLSNAKTKLSDKVLVINNN
jgi:protease II